MTFDLSCAGARIKALRLARSLTEEDLAKKLGIPHCDIVAMEDGAGMPTLEQALALASALDTTVDELFRKQDDATVPQKQPGMESLTELYKIGSGPSSSHTMGPEKACNLFRNQTPEANRYEVILYGSLAKTGKGHCTDQVIEKTLSPLPCKIIFDTATENLPHPNTMDLMAYNNETLLKRRAFSVWEAEPFVLKGKQRENRSIFTLWTPSTILPVIAKKRVCVSGNTYTTPRDRASAII